ncbi:hypothetical protein BGW42_003387 [Actinomortierella wolfii]|nr:hypothetical protein BGW42_003387 [Actinomortierella wolfii]
MKNFPGIRHTISTSVTVDGAFASVYQRWIIESIDDGFKTIKNQGTGYWLTARDGEAVGTPEFNNTASKWIIIEDDDGTNQISVPNQDLVVTPRRREPDYPITLFLEPANGSKAQRWSFERSD